MLVLVVVFLFGALMAGMTGWAWILQENIYEHRARLDSYYVERASDALRMRLARTGGLGTVSLTDITSTDEGFGSKAQIRTVCILRVLPTSPMVYGVLIGPWCIRWMMTVTFHGIRWLFLTIPARPLRGLQHRLHGAALQPALPMT